MNEIIEKLLINLIKKFTENNILFVIKNFIDKESENKENVIYFYQNGILKNKNFNIFDVNDTEKIDKITNNIIYKREREEIFHVFFIDENYVECNNSKKILDTIEIVKKMKIGNTDNNFINIYKDFENKIMDVKDLEKYKYIIGKGKVPMNFNSTLKINSYKSENKEMMGIFDLPNIIIFEEENPVKINVRFGKNITAFYMNKTSKVLDLINFLFELIGQDIKLVYDGKILRTNFMVENLRNKTIDIMN